MSYWNHHVEEYDRIVTKGITEKLFTNAGFSASLAERLFLEHIVSNLVTERVKQLTGRFNQYTIDDSLADWASDEITKQEQRYWEAMADNVWREIK